MQVNTCLTLRAEARAWVCLLFALPLIFTLIPASAKASTDDPEIIRGSGAENYQWTGHVNYIVGYKRMQRAWSPGRNQFVFGLVDFDIRQKGWPVSLTTQVNLAYAPKPPAQPGVLGDFGGTYEFNFGARKVLENRSRVHPFFGGGGSVLGGSTTTQIGSDFIQEGHAAGLGAWAEAGLYFLLNDHWQIGIRSEYSRGDINLFGNRLNAGGLHIQFLIGRHW